jgi:LCP family protein required for cell wall assembly
MMTVTQTISPTLTPTLTPTPMHTPTSIPTVAVSDDVVHILLIGLDSKRNLWAQNTDVLIVAVVNKSTRQVSLLSIPRDLWVYIPTYGWGRINMAHRKGFSNGYPGEGPGLLKDTLAINLGVPVDHWVRVDFEGFKRVVDELGGVEMTVACPVNLRYRPPSGGDATQEEQILQPGVYPMDGETALKYVRTRRGGSDFDRARRQHQFLKALWDQVKSPDLLPKIPGLWSALSDSFETDLGVGDVLSLAPMALELGLDRIRSRYIGPNQTKDWTTHLGWRVLLPRQERIQNVVNSLYAPPSQTGDELANEGARVQVRNGTSQQQLGLVAADQLRWEGIKVLDSAPADTPDYAQTQIVVYNDKPQTVALLSELLEVQQANIIYQPDPSQPADIVVIVGEDYDPCR